MAHKEGSGKWSHGEQQYVPIVRACTTCGNQEASVVAEWRATRLGQDVYSGKMRQSTWTQARVQLPFGSALDLSWNSASEVQFFNFGQRRWFRTRECDNACKTETCEVPTMLVLDASGSQSGPGLSSPDAPMQRQGSS